MGNWKYLIIRLKVPAEHQEEVSNWLDTLEAGLFTKRSGYTGVYGDWVYDGEASGNVGKCYSSGGDTHVYEDFCTMIKKFPFITGHVHVGEDYEESECSGTLVVRKGQVKWEKPWVALVKYKSESSDSESY
jgi:hypothetical protein